MRHFIIAKLKDSSTRDSLKEPVQELFNEALKIDGVTGVDVHVCNTPFANRYDLMIEMTMEEEALEAYNVSEMHQTWKREYGPHLEAKTIFDCE